MSGIAGLYGLDGRPLQRAAIERMLTSIAHRGPDGADVWVDGPVGLGHRMLWTTPESRQERLPLASGTGHIVLTADARIDNRGQLIAALGMDDRPPETPREYVNYSLYLEAKTFLHGLLMVDDKLAMAHSLETRVRSWTTTSSSSRSGCRSG